MSCYVLNIATTHKRLKENLRVNATICAEVAKMARRSDIDWEAVERDYRAGQLTFRQMADVHSVSVSQIREKAKARGWERNLADAIRERTKEKISQIDVAELIEQSAHESAQQSSQTQKNAIEIAADIATGVVMSHRKHYSRVKELASGMLDEIQEFGESKLEIAQLVQLVGQDDQLAAQALKRATGLAGRVQSLEKLANTLVKIADAERKAFGIDEDEKTGTTIEDLLDKLPLK